MIYDMIWYRYQRKNVMDFLVECYEARF